MVLYNFGDSDMPFYAFIAILLALTLIPISTRASALTEAKRNARDCLWKVKRAIAQQYLKDHSHAIQSSGSPLFNPLQRPPVFGPQITTYWRVCVPFIPPCSILALLAPNCIALFFSDAAPFSPRFQAASLSASLAAAKEGASRHASV